MFKQQEEHKKIKNFYNKFNKTKYSNTIQSIIIPIIYVILIYGAIAIFLADKNYTMVGITILVYLVLCVYSQVESVKLERKQIETYYKYKGK